MRRPFRSSISRWLLLATFVAIDAALLRSTRNDPGVFVLVPALQAAVFLALPRRGGLRPGWAGFVATGVLVLALYSGVRGPFQGRPWRWLSYANPALNRLAYSIDPQLARNGREPYVWRAISIVGIGLPMLAIAGAGGLGVSGAARVMRFWKDRSGGSADEAEGSPAQPEMAVLPDHRAPGLMRMAGHP